MIVPMKKVLLLALKREQESTLTQLRNLGVVEVVAGELADSADRSRSSALLAALDRVIGALSSRKAGAAGGLPAVPETENGLLEYALQSFAESENLAREMDALRKEKSALEPWGEYSPEKIAALRGNDIYVYLCEGSAEQFHALQSTLENAAVELISNQQGLYRFAVIAQGGITDVVLPEVIPGDRALSLVEADITRVAGLQQNVERKFDAITGKLDMLRIARSRAASENELLSVRDGLSDCGEIVALRGFVPAPAAEKLLDGARKNAWALSLSDPEPGEEVPVLMEPPRWVKPVLPLFQFLGIAPGYDEFDMSPGMLIFFSIFFSMIINDAGYALVMLAGAVIAAVLLRKNRKAVLPCRLAIVLSGCASVWGIINGAYFGTETHFLQVGFFASGSNQMAHLQLVCFVLALVHLSLGHCWRLVNANGVLDVIGQLGWIPILLLDFMVVLGLLVFPGMELPAWSLWAGGIGLAMVLIGGVDWRDVGAVCNIPFDLIGSFTDTLSYVRLFAVGMSGTYMAQSFNDMGVQLWNISPWLLPASVLVIVFGHLLNVVLAFMSVLVHGVRLNTLEFSNHAGIRWGGQTYKPLKNFEQ